MLALRLLLAAQFAFAATIPVFTLLARQELTPSAGCVSSCTVVEEPATAGNTSLATLCTSAVVNAYAQCYSCMVGAAVFPQDVAQEIVDGYASDCSGAGFPVSTATVSETSDGTGTGTTVATGGTAVGMAG
ncbi:hypothetical protein C8F04DRAFT_1110321 [Mycena alexandri]|uniref:Uncharacterized protein n=1 Tax=Mycena alexandri TaxID=1745969 RepID=A0AAD6SP34_9AGAR|nr:hypothetical protein C8F04DRAFT_1110321 [Mycena alexandri]